MIDLDNFMSKIVFTVNKRPDDLGVDFTVGIPAIKESVYEDKMLTDEFLEMFKYKLAYELSEELLRSMGVSQNDILVMDTFKDCTPKEIIEAKQLIEQRRVMETIIKEVFDYD